MKPIQIDGSFGEGGGQVLRTSLALAALTGRHLEIDNIRAGRKKPGLRPQHLTAVRAVAALCAAECQGAELGSRRLAFRPGGPPAGGEYCFDVAEAARGGSAGSTTLIAQAVLWPLTFAGRSSRLTLRGGTHVPWSPPFHYLRDVVLAAASEMGLRAAATLKSWGWYPVGGGEVELVVHPAGRLAGLQLAEPGELLRVTGEAVVTNLPAHIPQRMADRARRLLEREGVVSDVKPLRKRGPSAGAGIFLTAHYLNGPAGFSALGRRGKPSEEVAEEACAALLNHHRSGAAVDRHLADQLVLPLALAAGDSLLATSQISQHTLTNVHVIGQFIDAEIKVEQRGPRGIIRITGTGFHV